MNNLALDKEEVPEASSWVAHMRRRHGIRPNESTTWFVEVEQARINGKLVYDHDVKWFSRSPGDALAWAELYADDARKVGIGRWVLETYGDGENSPRNLLVVPNLDEEGCDE